MARQQRQMEGGSEERRRKAREARRQGKRGTRSTGKARPGNRDTDPKRTSRWE